MGSGVKGNTVVLAELERIVRQDFAGRGLTAGESERGRLAPGELARAIEDLAMRATGVVLLTGFFIPHGEPPAAETDGPPGTIVLAAVLQAVGIPCWVVTDSLCVSAVRATAELAGWEPERVREYPWPRQEVGARGGSWEPESEEGLRAAWRREFWKWARGERVSHCVAIERVGPSHDERSLADQTRSGPVPEREFCERVRPAERGVCHNMRGVALDNWTGDLHRLFEEGVSDEGIHTIGVGDGANELGMGRIAWEELAARLTGEQAGRVPCRVPCDDLVIAGVSNWGAQGLAAGVAWRRERADVLALHSVASQWRVLSELVARGLAVDGVTGRATATVDGLEFARYIAPWEEMLSLLGVS